MAELPDWVVGGVGERKTQLVKQNKKTSAFQITLDSNESGKSYMFGKTKEDRKHREDRYYQLIELRDALRQKFLTAELLKSPPKNKEWHPPNLISIEGNPEIGNENQRMHIHILVQFDGPTHIDLNQAKTWLKETTGESGWHMDAKFISNGIENARAYSKKEVIHRVEANDLPREQPAPQEEPQSEPQIPEFEDPIIE